MTSVALNPISRPLLVPLRLPSLPPSPDVDLPYVLTLFQSSILMNALWQRRCWITLLPRFALIAFRILRASVNVTEDERDGYYYHAIIEKGSIESSTTIFLDPRESTLFINDGVVDSIKS